MSESIIRRALASPDLPSLPGVALKVLSLARQPNVSLEQLTDAVSTDSALAGKILKTVNSPLYALRHPVSTLSRAVVVLGTQGIRTMTLGFSLARAVHRGTGAGMDLESYWRHSVYASMAARALCEATLMEKQEEASLAALLQDVGILGLRAAEGEAYDALVAEAADHESLSLLERSAYGLDHARMGEAMAQHWKLPRLLAVPIAFHHRPREAPQEYERITRVVAVSHAAAVLLTHVTPHGASRMQDAARDLLDLTPKQVQDVLVQTSRGMKDVSEFFDVKIESQAERERVLALARQALEDVSLRTQRLTSELQEQNRGLMAKARTDPLTGLGNRACLEEALPALFDAAVRGDGSFGVLFLDMDHFKAINDTFGHTAGDAVLAQLGRILNDACGESGLSIRYGGDEIVCLLPDVDLAGAIALGERIRRRVETAAIEHKGTTIPLTVSVGVAVMERAGDFESAEQLLSAADAGLYEAKAAGRNAVRSTARVHV